MALTDIYKGEEIYIWHDGKFAFIAIFFNGITFSFPLGNLAGLLSDFTKAQAFCQLRQIDEGIGG